jgi:hypothetical protein
MDKIIISANLTRIYTGVFEQHSPTIPLDLHIYLNKEKIFEFDSSLQQSKFFTEITNLPDDRCCTLQFVMNNKTYEHTKIDGEGNMIGDCRIAISNLAFEDVELGHIVTEKAVYLHNENTPNITNKENKFYGEMGCNGTVDLKFYTPVYVWLLENL